MHVFQPGITTYFMCAKMSCMSVIQSEGSWSWIIYSYLKKLELTQNLNSWNIYLKNWNVILFCRECTVKEYNHYVDYEHLIFQLVLPCWIKVDKGTKTTISAPMHSYLRSQLGNLADATNSVIHSPSTQNKIESRWRGFLKRIERYFKHQLNDLVGDGELDCDDDSHR